MFIIVIYWSRSWPDVKPLTPILSNKFRKQALFIISSSSSSSISITIVLPWSNFPFNRHQGRTKGVGGRNEPHKKPPPKKIFPVFSCFSHLMDSTKGQEETQKEMKRALRKQLNSLLVTIPQQELERQGELVGERVLGHPWFKESTNICVYLHM